MYNSDTSHKTQVNMAGFNKVIILGNVGNEPKIIEVLAGKKVARFSVATSYKEQTEWHSVVAWSPLADNIERLVHKGSQVLIEGRLNYNKYTDREGVEKSVPEITAQSFQLAGGRKDDDLPM